MKQREFWCVYCHINKINNKKYIGITNNIKRRWRCNGIEYKPDKNDNQNRAFWNAIQKYGWYNFEHIILVDYLTQKEAQELEKYYIRKYKTFIGFFDKKEDRLGYNSTLGGEGTSGLKGELHHNFGKKMSDQQKALLKEANKKKIVQYDKNGNKIKEWDSLTSTSTALHIDMKVLWQLLNGQRKTYKNFVFRYFEDSFDKYDVNKLNMNGENHPMFNRQHTYESKQLISQNRIGKCKGSNNHHSHKVYCDGQTFSCIKECAEYLQVKYQTLVSWLSGQNTMPIEYVNRNLMYYEEFEKRSA